MRPFALRHHYRFPVFGRVMYESANREGYGTVMNVSFLGWRVGGSLLLGARGRVFSESQTIYQDMGFCLSREVRWVQGEEAGIETLVMNEESEAPLNAYILERIKAL